MSPFDEVGFSLTSFGLLWGSASAALFSAVSCAAIHQIARGVLVGRFKTRLAILLGSFTFFMTSYFTTLFVAKNSNLFFLELALSLLLATVLARSLADMNGTNAGMDHETKTYIKDGDE